MPVPVERINKRSVMWDVSKDLAILGKLAVSLWGCQKRGGRGERRVERLTQQRTRAKAPSPFSLFLKAGLSPAAWDPKYSLCLLGAMDKCPWHMLPEWNHPCPPSFSRLSLNLAVWVWSRAMFPHISLRSAAKASGLPSPVLPYCPFPSLPSGP